MGTYTTNYNLFMPSIGEQGWGELVNGNFSTIDNTMKGLSNNIETLGTEIDAVEERVTVLEAGEFETVNAGTIVANELYGKRVGVWTTTKPYEWSFPIGDTTIYTYGHEGSQLSFEVTISDDFDFTNMYGWDVIDFDSSEPIAYTIRLDNDDYYGARINSATVTFTDAITGNSVTETYTPSNPMKDATFTKTGLSPFVKVSGNISFGQCNVTATFSITRPVVYIKPKSAQ